MCLPNPFWNVLMVLPSAFFVVGRSVIHCPLCACLCKLLLSIWATAAVNQYSGQWSPAPQESLHTQGSRPKICFCQRSSRLSSFPGKQEEVCIITKKLLGKQALLLPLGQEHTWEGVEEFERVASLYACVILIHKSNLLQRAEKKGVERV